MCVKGEELSPQTNAFENMNISLGEMFGEMHVRSILEGTHIAPILEQAGRGPR
jgi:hypothetical protein